MDKLILFYEINRMTDDVQDFLAFRGEKIKPTTIFTKEEIRLFYDPIRKTFTNKYIVGGGRRPKKEKVLVY